MAEPLVLERITYRQDRTMDRLRYRWQVYRKFDYATFTLVRPNEDDPGPSKALTKRGVLRKYNRACVKLVKLKGLDTQLLIQDAVTKKWRIATPEENVEEVLTQ